VQQGLAQLLTDSVGPELGPAAQLLTGKLRSPIEVSGAAMPAPWVIVALTLDIHSNAELESLLNQIAQTTPLPPLQGAIDAEGFARMQAGIPVWLHFDAVTGRLAMYGGLNAERAAFAALLDARDSAAGR
jgi:hypothetical protein